MRYLLRDRTQWNRLSRLKHLDVQLAKLLFNYSHLSSYIIASIEKRKSMGEAWVTLSPAIWGSLPVTEWVRG